MPWRSVRPVFFGLLVAFSLLVALRLHGFSLPVWHQVIEGGPAPEVLLGAPRAIRIDDYAVRLPLALAQAHHEPAFPVVNQTVGLGQNMLVPFSWPVLHPATLFRPEVWGYFLGDDVGLAWHWWFPCAAVFGAWFAVLYIVTDGRRWLAGLASALLLGSPFLQFWSLVPAPPLYAAGLCVLAALAFARARSPVGILGAALALGWSAGAFALTLYPPLQVPLAHLAVFLVVGLLLEHREAIDLRRHAAWRGLGAALALAVAGLALASLLLGANDAVARIVDSAYPGRRLATGGDHPLWALFNGNFAFAWRVGSFGQLLNICEAASFWLLSPAAALAFLLRGARRGGRLDRFTLVMLGFVLLLTAFCTLGVPESVARATGMAWSAGRRASLALGVADVVLLARVLSGFAGDGGLGRRGAAGVALGFMLLLGLCAASLRGAVPEVPVNHLVVLVVLNGLLAWSICRALRPRLALGALTLCVLLSTLWFNPLSRGGADYLQDNALAREIRRIDRATPGGSVWVAYHAPLASNLFRVVGVRCLNGVLAVPALELWSVLDPSGRDREIYNRYAQVVFDAPVLDELEFVLPYPDVFHVRAAPTHPRLRQLGVTHVLLRSRTPRRFEARWGLERLTSVGAYHLFRLPP